MSTVATDRTTWHVVQVRRRTTLTLGLVTAVGVLAFGWPLLVDAKASLAHRSDAPWLFVLLLPLVLAVVLAEIADGGMDAKAVALLGVLASVGAALRPLGGGAAGFEPVFFLLVLSGRVLGRGFGFVLGSVTLFASALLTAGVGPWLPFQMLAAGAPLAHNLTRFVGYTLATSLGFDIPRAVTNAVLVAMTGRPVLLALRRVARRAAFEAPVEFDPPPSTGSEPPPSAAQSIMQ
jgi:energy-coupling factor transport system substrate-specific component